MACPASTSGRVLPVTRRWPFFDADIPIPPPPEPDPLQPGDEGIDVSHHQGVIDWPAVAGTGIRFAFIRASYGDNIRDLHWGNNWQGAKAVGLRRGAYHYLTPWDDAGEQTDLFLSQLGADFGELPPVLDVEEANLTAAMLFIWLDRVYAVTRTLPLIYTSAGAWSAIGNPTGFSGYPLWVASWRDGAPILPAGWTDYSFWQYTDRGVVDGLNPCDRDRKH